MNQRTVRILAGLGITALLLFFSFRFLRGRDGDPQGHRSPSPVPLEPRQDHVTNYRADDESNRH